GDNNAAVAGPVSISLTPPPDFTLTHSAITTPGSTAGVATADAGTSVDVTWTVQNLGPGVATGMWYDSLELREVGGAGRTFGLGLYDYAAPLPAGQSYTRTELVRLPASVQGVFQMVVRTNTGTVFTPPVFEGGATANNTLFDPDPITLVVPPNPDLQVFAIDDAPAAANAGGTVSLDYTVINQGTVAARGQWTDNVYVSLKDHFDSTAVLLGSFGNQSALQPGEKYQTQATGLPVPKRLSGPAYLIVVANATGAVDETPHGDNNTLVRAITINPEPPADLVTGGVTAAAQAFSGTQVQVTYHVSNLGVGPTDQTAWTDTVWLARDPKRTNTSKGDVLLATIPHTGVLGNDPTVVSPPTGYDVTVTVTLPSHISGQFYITPWADTFDVVLKSVQSENVNPDDPTELNNDNYKARPITVLLTPPPDLVVAGVTAPAAAVGGDQYPVQWTVRNQGTSATEDADLFDAVYLSDSPTFNAPGAKQWFLGTVGHDGAVSPGGSYTANATFALSPEISGKYVIVVTNVGAPSFPPTWEGAYTNNNTGVATTHVTPLAPADLRVTAVATPGVNYSGEPTTVNWTVTNTGAAAWAGTRYWTDAVYFSRYPTLDTARDTLVGQFAHSNAQPLAAGASYTNSAAYTLPPGIGGTAASPQTFYVYVITDPTGGLTAQTLDNDGSRASFGARGYEAATNKLGTQTLPVVYREPDLQVTRLTPPAAEPHAGDTIAVGWTVANVGGRDTRQGAWVDRVYLSRDPSLDAGDAELGELSHDAVLRAGDSYTANLTVRLPDDIGGTYYLLVFTDATARGTIGVFGIGSDSVSGRVPEFQGEGNNITAALMPVLAGPPPDLQVAAVTAVGPDPAAPGHVLTGQSFTVNWTVTNAGGGDTPDRQSAWSDYVYLSRDPFLSDADRYFTAVPHTGGLAAGASYAASATIQAPRDLSGPWYVFVLTDPADQYNPRGKVIEADEGNNATPTATPLLIDQPPPSDLVVTAVSAPATAQSGDLVHLTWTVTNAGVNPATGTWHDTAYLSADNAWDVADVPVGRFTFTGTLAPGGTYTAVLDVRLPPATPGDYRVIVRTDVFDEVVESNDLNNTTVSAGTLRVTVPELHLGVPLPTTLDPGESRLYQVTVAQGDTLQVGLTSSAAAANEVFLRYAALPTGTTYDATYQGALQANQTAVIPSATAGTYYVLVRGQSEPAAGTPVTVLATVLPFGITDVLPDDGGDSKYVSTTILGAQFDPQAVVKLVRPGIAEYEPVSYAVQDKTRIQATFDLTGAPHGLYDVEVINPDGRVALAPYRYLIEQALPPDVSVALGGPRVVWAGQSGLYGLTLTSRTNVDLPYVYFQYGIPELGVNSGAVGSLGTAGGVPYLGLSTSLGGSPAVADVPWASVDPVADTTGQDLASGYAVDFADRASTTLSFLVQTYPDGLPGGAYSDQPGATAFAFNITAAATPLTRDEYVAQQTAFALALRAGVLNDATAAPALRALAADAGNWTDLYLTALTQAGLLRPEDQPPGVHANPVLVSLQATLAAGILAGPAGNQIITGGNLVDFFNQVEKWYGADAAKLTPYTSVGTDSVSPHEPTTYLIASPPPASDFDLGLAARTHYEGFAVYVPWANDWDTPWTFHTNDQTHPENPSYVNVQAPNFAPFFTGTGRSGQASINGPLAYGPDQFVPLGHPLPFTVQFANATAAPAAVGEVRVVETLDPNLDPETFRLGDLQLGDLKVHIPNSVGSFQGDFDFTKSKGFILRVSAGIDLSSNTVTWLLQAIDPLTGEVVTDPAKGLLPADTAAGAGEGFVTYTAQPKAGLATGTPISAQARVLFNTTAPLDTPTLTYTVDGTAPTTTLTATPVTPGGADYQVAWASTDDAGGSGVKSVTVYVSRDGGGWTIWQSQTTATSGVYNGQPGHTYTFLALAVDNAGNQEQPPTGTDVPDDDSAVNLGGLPTVGGTSVDLGTPPPPATQPPVNGLFTQAQQGVPSAPSASHPAEFGSVLAPFSAESFATGISASTPTGVPGIAPLALLVLADNTVLVSGGPDRNQLFHLGRAGGAVGDPVATLDEPIYDMALGADGVIWAATGGGPLYELDPHTFAVLGRFGDGLTQALAVQPGTGKVFVASDNGIEVFDPAAATFSHFSDIRVGSLAFAPDGTLWAATWPHDQTQVIRFSGTPAAPHLMFQFDSDVGSIAFGQPGSELDGLLFVSHSDEATAGSGTSLTMIDLATLRQVTLATGGTRGGAIKTSADGRVFLSQSHQVDVLGPLTPPHVAAVNPPAGAVAALPLAGISVTFDADMLADDPADPHSVLNPNNYRLTGDSAGAVSVVGVAYDAASRTAVLTFPVLTADRYHLAVLTGLTNDLGVALEQEYDSAFTATADLSAVLSLHFSTARSDRATGTVSFDVTVTNTSPHDVLVPVVLRLTPVNNFPGQPQGNQGRAPDGSWLIDLGADLPADGILHPGQSSAGRTITIISTGGRTVAYDPGVTGVPQHNSAPVFVSLPVAGAVVGQPYQYQAIGFDPDGDALSYLLVRGPAGMTVDAATGLVRWTPTAASAAPAVVSLQVYDAAGVPATQTFTVQVAGANQPPAFSAPATQVTGSEGVPLHVPVLATDPENDPLVYWAENLPPGAAFDPATRSLDWTPGAQAAGTYPNVRFVVSDGLHQVSRTVTVVIAPTPQPPTFLPPAEVTGREGDPVHVQLLASDPHGAAVTYTSSQLPLGAFLDPHTGLFTWTPDYTQQGFYSVPVTAVSGSSSTTQNLRIFVLNANAAPVFPDLSGFVTHQGQDLQFLAAATDPDNPAYIPPTRTAAGTVVSGALGRVSVTYTVAGLPAGATFDPDTLLFDWTPGFDELGTYHVTVTATDDGDGTGTPLSTAQTITITVLPTNRPPQVPPIANQTVAGGAALDLTVRTSDPDHNALTLSAVGVPGFGTFTDNGDGTGTFHFAPTLDDRGNYTMTLHAVDDGDGGATAALSADQSFVLTVAVPNAPPHLAPIGYAVAVVGQPLRLTVNATDADQEPLTYALTGLPAGATITPSGVYGQAVITWTPTAADVGADAVLVAVTDGGNGDPTRALTDRRAFTLVVRTSDQPPVWLPPGGLSAPEGRPFSTQFQAVDPDGDPLTYAATNLPVGAALDPVTGVLSWTPGLFQVGTYAGVVLSATDGNQVVTQTVTLTVTAVNEPPHFIPLTAQSGREGTALQFTVAAEDPNTDPLTYSVAAGLPAGATFDGRTGRFQWAPGYDQAGDYIVTFRVADPAGLTDTMPVAVHIADVDRAPVLGTTDHVVVVGRTFDYTPSATDPDTGAVLTFTATGLPDGATLDAHTGRLVWTPGPAQTGDFPVRLTVS
ncbi:MAG TPA: putative Ig domain-containing protein, partial [Urbifossiella sp.]|nr:putative Ig domain-containing protein [Urbifossiella sp.]